MSVRRVFSHITLAASLCLALAPQRADACDVALVLAMDVSGSVDAYEYSLQAHGIAQAIRDPQVQEALVHGRASLAIVQWSGALEQTVTLPWTRITEPADAQAVATRVQVMPRAHAGGNTAVGEAIHVSAALLDQVRDCARWVIDVSGDGDENESFTLGTERVTAYRRGIQINGLAIEAAGQAQSITNFYRRHVVTPGGFVITARQHEDFARAMREKMLRELVAPMASLPAPLPRSPSPGPEFAALAIFLPTRTR
ncbi:DUF1194 domain-containing protein [Rhodobacter sp. NTK016B]|uniref:DUF1194 domain-containing protein n=1 Tax=Rhodobacter sp. NTK016B TaxID=2759676 RepID=UPI001A8E7E6E|nr:DUF1194 domain-containing protein [Rhodobacter sp. NTK016B]MBN8293848.1 DUF1194 domain-containing protein [Rhodobacter sp. NTK016B]